MCRTGGGWFTGSRGRAERNLGVALAHCFASALHPVHNWRHVALIVVAGEAESGDLCTCLRNSINEIPIQGRPNLQDLQNDAICQD